jgi:hypothetical protein
LRRGLYLFTTEWFLPFEPAHGPRIEVLVKAEHDFYREKWQKEQNKRSGFISHVIRCDTH